MCSTGRMRWDGQAVAATDAAALPGLTRMPGLIRTVHTPDFSGVTFYEVAARSALNAVPAASSMPFRWTSTRGGAAPTPAPSVVSRY